MFNVVVLFVDVVKEMLKERDYVLLFRLFI